MKNKLNAIGTFLFLIYGLQVHAQDLIVTHKNDSINAKIIKTKNEMLHFYFVKEGDLRKTLLPLTKVKSHKKNFFSNSEVPINYKDPKGHLEPKWKLKFFGGPSYITAKTSSDTPELLMEFADKLRSGRLLGFQAHYMTNDYIGFGLVFTDFYTSHSRRIYFPSFNGIGVLDLASRIHIYYVGPSIFSQLLSSNKKSAFVSTISLGHLQYIENIKNSGQNSKASQRTLGLNMSLGYDFYLNKNLSLGGMVNFTTGDLNKMDIEMNGLKETLDEKFDLTHINLSIGICWVF